MFYMEHGGRAHRLVLPEDLAPPYRLVAEWPVQPSGTPREKGPHANPILDVNTFQSAHNCNRWSEGRSAKGWRGAARRAPRRRAVLRPETSKV
jgi:hypothetical protein